MGDVLKKNIAICLSWVIIYFYPTGKWLLLVGFFVMADTITGVIAAGLEDFKTKRFMDCIRKYAVYGTAVLVAHVLQMQFFPDFPAMKIISGLIAYNELMSIDENIQKMTGFSLFKFFIKKLK